MAFSETVEYDKITIAQPYAGISVRKATVIKKDGVEVARSFERYALAPGYYNESDVFVETDLSTQPEEVQNICNVLWTTQVKDDWKAFLKRS
tara:strand:+ start:197 stop:472 length:276 start_codon:yes stop_codon:yes gene_type:complete